MLAVTVVEEGRVEQAGQEQAVGKAGWRCRAWDYWVIEGLW